MVFKKVTLIHLLLTVTFLKEVVFSATVPLWHTPDEQAHFAQVAYFAEFNKMPKGPKDLNKEIHLSEQLLGTDRDERGNNKFTFHPEYRIEYTKDFTGKYEEEIKSIPQSYRQQLVKQEAANYPPFYYILAAIPYKIFYDSDLITRVFLVRLLSIVLAVWMVYLTWLISKVIFPSSKLLQITLPILVSFQPMLSFVFAGVTSDNLLNFLFTGIIYQSLLIIKDGFNRRVVILVSLIILLLVLTKPQFVLAFPIVGVAIFLYLLSKHNLKWIISFLLISVFSIFISILFAQFILRPVFSYLEAYIYPQSFYRSDPIFNKDLFRFIKETLLHTIKEVIPWYWGVFDWLGVALPRDVNRVINRIMVLAAIGVFIKLILLIKKRSKEDLYFIFMILTTLIYFAGITYYNYLFYLDHGFPFGIQGRYYFPTVVSHMSLLLIGLLFFIPSRFTKLKEGFVKLLTFLMVVLNFIGLWIISKTYFDLGNFNNFIIQVSQYKPWFFKGGLYIFWIFCYIVSLTIFLLSYLKISREKSRG